MTWRDVFIQYDEVVLSSAELRAQGATEDALTAAVRGGHLIRARRDHYLLPDAAPELIRAVRVGGRLACISALAAEGVFALSVADVHVHMAPTMSRARSAASVRVPLAIRGEGVELHWRPLFGESHGTRASVSIPDALAQTVRCQHPWHAVASIDSALQLRLASRADIVSVFTHLPARLQYLKGLIDGRAEAGQESVLRMIVVSTGLPFEIQVEIPGVGRVDLLVAGCLVVEADSRLAHDGWEKHVEDRKRDLLLAALDLMSLRPAYQHTMHEPDLVARAILRLVRAHRQRSG